MIQLKALPQRSNNGGKTQVVSIKEQDVLVTVAWVTAVGLTSLAVGILAGLLIAPRSGQETREMLADSANWMTTEIQGAASGAAKEITNAGANAQQTIRDLAMRFSRS